MTEQLTWKPIKVALGDLIPNPNNPKSSDEETVERLRDSIDTLGQFETLAVDSDGVSAVDGHQRLNAWIDALGADFVVDAMQASRPLTEEEKRKIILYSGKGTHGQWIEEMLAEHFQPTELEEWGGFDLSDDGGSIKGHGEKQIVYTAKIESPVYEPTTKDMPSISSLYDEAKTDELISEIKGSDLDNPELTKFLLSAARRHSVFRYDQIAEYYAHADERVRNLFVRSGLVIVDIDSAIEGGFVQLSKKLDTIYQQDEDRKSDEVAA